MTWTIIERFGPIFLMACVLIFSRILAQRGQRQRLKAEAKHLRYAIAVSFQGMRSVYANNLALLESGELNMISCRNQIAMLRPQLGRLIALDEGEIHSVLLACITVEHAETAMAVSGKPIRGVSFQLKGQIKAVSTAGSALTSACRRLALAERLLVPNAGAEIETVPDIEAPRLPGDLLSRESAQASFENRASTH